jgi:hypothetical protein
MKLLVIEMYVYSSSNPASVHQFQFLTASLAVILPSSTLKLFFSLSLSLSFSFHLNTSLQPHKQLPSCSEAAVLCHKP